MTREEFKIEFSQDVCEGDEGLYCQPYDNGEYWDLSPKGIDRLSEIAVNIAEPLFEEIERLSLEVVKLREDNLSAIAREGIQWGKVQELEAKLLWWRENYGDKVTFD